MMEYIQFENVTLAKLKHLSLDDSSSQVQSRLSEPLDNQLSWV